LQAEIKRSRSNDPSPLQLINNPEKIWEGQNNEFISFGRLKNRSHKELKKYQDALASEKETYEKYLKKFTDIEANLERAIKYSQTKPKQVPLKAEDVRCFVFWTKNPGPMMDRLDELKDYHYYFHFTLTPDGKDLEKKLPPKRQTC
jgi:hypothetical protein